MDKPVISVSAKEEQGLDQLELTVKNMFYDGKISFNDEIYITNIRQKAALTEALESLNQVSESIQNQMPEDFFSIDLMNAYEELGSIRVIDEEGEGTSIIEKGRFVLPGTEELNLPFEK